MDEVAQVVFSNPLFLTIILLLVTILTMVLKRSNNSGRGPSLPPGPKKLPIIGNLHQMSGSGLPHARLRELARVYGPMMHLQLGEASTVVVSSPELAKEFLQSHDLNFATKPFLPSASIIFYNARDIVFAPYGDYWRQMKKICVVELLSAKRVKLLRPVREEEVNRMVRSISSSVAAAGQATNLSRLIFTLSNSMACRTAFGKAQKQEESFLQLVEEIIKALGGFSLGDLFPSSKLVRLISGDEKKLKKLHREADVILQQVIDDHIAARRETAAAADTAVRHHDNDLVDVLLNLMANNDNLGFPITHLEIKAVILDMFVGGSDTVAVTVEWAMLELMKHPNIMEKAQNEVRCLFDGRGTVDEADIDQLHYLKRVIKETLRLHPPGTVISPRECRETTVISGYQIPAKTHVIVNVWAIGRDPCYWEDPESFTPERFINTHVDYNKLDFKLLPFGAGRRMCPGITYAMAIVNVVLANLLYHFDWKLPFGMKPQDLEMEEEFGIAVRRKGDLVLIPIPYTPPQPA
ncbi:unnamed protein product [Linum tenue]|uniref:Cytochrome P450 n=1 Tax=Linum tenue TaxID=586396 RepID=A0AAV0HSB0_9ROSI|nr:unnamed protein product [Linum tenue]